MTRRTSVPGPLTPSPREGVSLLPPVYKWGMYETQRRAGLSSKRDSQASGPGVQGQGGPSIGAGRSQATAMRQGGPSSGGISDHSHGVQGQGGPSVGERVSDHSHGVQGQGGPSKEGSRTTAMECMGRVVPVLGRGSQTTAMVCRGRVVPALGGVSDHSHAEQRSG